MDTTNYVSEDIGFYNYYVSVEGAHIKCSQK